MYPRITISMQFIIAMYNKLFISLPNVMIPVDEIV